MCSKSLTIFQCKHSIWYYSRFEIESNVYAFFFKFLIFSKIHLRNCRLYKSKRDHELTKIIKCLSQFTSSFRESDDNRDSHCSYVARYVSCFARSSSQLNCSINNHLVMLKEIFVINVMLVNIEIFVINVIYVNKIIFVINEIFVVKITFAINVIFYEFVHFRNIVLLLWCLIVLIYVF